MFLNFFNWFFKLIVFSIFNFCSKTNLMEEENPSLETQENVVLEVET